MFRVVKLLPTYHVVCFLDSVLRRSLPIITGGKLDDIVLCYQLCIILPIIQIFLVDDSTNRTEEPKSNKLATSLYEDTQPPTASKDDGYEHVELKSTAAVESEEIKLSSNAAYGRVQK